MAQQVVAAPVPQPELSQEDRIARLTALLQQDNIVQLFRDQNKQLESLINYDCLRWLVELVVVVGPEEDPIRSCKLPFNASDVLCVDARNFSDWMFAGCQAGPPLLAVFLRFLQGEPNYILAGYFAKVFVSIIKRSHSVQSKYNEQLCQAVFAAETRHGLLNHLYSRSMVEPIIKILTLRSKDKDYAAEKLQLVVSLASALENGQPEDCFGDAISEVFSSLTSNDFSQKINYELVGMVFGVEVVSRIFNGLGSDNTTRKYKAKIAALYLGRLRAVREKRLTDEKQATIIDETLGRCEAIMNEYCAQLLKYFHSEISEKKRAGAHTLCLLECLYLLMITPRLLNEQNENLLCEHMPDLFQIIRQNPLNNILHNLIVRLSKQFGVRFKHQPQRMLQYLNVLVGVLLTFNEIINEEHRRKIAYTGCLLNLSEFLLSVMETYKYEKTEEWAAYELSLCRLLTEISELRVGAYTIKPQHLPIVYSRSAVAPMFKQFLRQDPIIEYEESKIQKEQHFEQLKEKKLEELMLSKTTDIQTAKFEVEEEFELYRYWKEGNRLKYDLEELMSDI